MDDLAQTRVAYGTVYLTQLYNASTVSTLLNDSMELNNTCNAVIDRVRSGRAHLFLRLRAERGLHDHKPVLRKLAKFSGFELDDVNGDVVGLITEMAGMGIPLGVRVTPHDKSILRRISDLAARVHIQFVHIVGFDSARTDTVQALFGGYTLHTFPCDWLLWSTKASQPVYGLVDLADATYRPLLGFPTELVRRRNVQTPRDTGFQDVDTDYIDFRNGSVDIPAWVGWLFLAATWTFVVVGLITVLDLWHVLPPGTPSSPIRSYEDFEDETGYPIPTYYPLIIVLLPAVLWVWSIVSWMGMKFFRHARAEPS